MAAGRGGAAGHDAVVLRHGGRTAARRRDEPHGRPEVLAHDERPDGLRRRRADRRGHERRRPVPRRACRRAERPGRRGVQRRDHAHGRQPRVGVRAPLPHGGGAGRGLSAGDEDHGLLVRSRSGPGPGHSRWRADRRIRGAVPAQRGASFGRRAGHPAVADGPAGRLGDGCGGRAHHAGADPLRSGAARGEPVRLALRGADLHGPRAAAGHLRVPRSHVGAVRDVDLGSAVPDGRLRRGRVERDGRAAGGLCHDRRRRAGLHRGGTAG